MQNCQMMITYLQMETDPSCNFFTSSKVHSNLSDCFQKYSSQSQDCSNITLILETEYTFVTAKCSLTFCYVSCICDKWGYKGHFLLEMRAIYRHRKVCKSSDLSKIPCIISHRSQSLRRV